MSNKNKIYDVLKYITLFLLPALSVFYVSLAGVWGWPLSDEIAGTIAAVVAFLATVLGISSVHYNNKEDK